MTSRGQTARPVRYSRPDGRKRFPGRTWLLACCIATACSSAPHASSAQTSVPAASAALDRLAVATKQGVLLWSSVAGLRRIGPPLSTSPGSSVSKLTWSPDGRYLAWVQGTYYTGDVELVRYDTRAGTSTTWQDQQDTGPISFSGSDPVTIAGSFLYKFEPGGGTTPIAIAAASSGASTPYANGFVFTSNQANINSPVQIWRASTSGDATQLGTLPATGYLSEYAEISASADGQSVALEEGDHTDVCGNGPSSRLILMNLKTGAVTSLSPPVTAHAVWRFTSIMYGTDSVIDFSAFEATLCNANMRFPTRLFEVDAGHLRTIADNVTVGQRGPNGQLAAITGQDAYIALNGPDLVIDGKQQLEVNGKAIPTPAIPTSLSWAPQNPEGSAR